MATRRNPTKPDTLQKTSDGGQKPAEGQKPKLTLVQNLSLQQARAIDLLIAGNTITGAAEELGLTRQTVSEWYNHDRKFQEQLEVRRHEIWATAREELASLLPKAIEVLRKELEGESRLKAAALIIKAMQLDQGHVPLSAFDLDDLAYGRKQRNLFAGLSKSLRADEE